jgi:histidinol phosphatase-like enzyme (inositol monophosphatase family)
MADTKDAESFVKLGHTLADAAAAITLSYFRSDVAVEDKDDESPVTRADRETESALREIISAKFPGHGIIGEEFGSENPDAEFVWVLDPIDGTVSFINGVPLFTTIIGLLENGTPAFGVLDQPVLRDRWIGGVGLPTQRNGQVARVRPCSGLGQASVYITAPDFFDPTELAAVGRLEHAAKLRRYGGTDCYHYGMVASGWTDIACEKLSVYEYGAMVPIIESAGGVMTDWQGKALTGTAGRQVLASANRRIHDQAIEVLNG